MSARSCSDVLAVVIGLLVAFGGDRSRLTLDAASIVRYEEVKDWPALPAGVQLGEVPGVDVDTNGHVLIFIAPAEGSSRARQSSSPIRPCSRSTPTRAS